MNRLEITDLFKGAYFLTCSGRIKEARLVDGNQVRFIIEGENLYEEEQRYLTGQARVNPLQLKECLNYLRQCLSRTLHPNPKNPNRKNHETIHRRSDRAY